MKCCENPLCFNVTRRFEDFCSEACWDAYYALVAIEYQGLPS